MPASFVLLDMVGVFAPQSQKDVVFQDRNFFGTLTIREQDSTKIRKRRVRCLLNGTTIHGSQFRTPESAYAADLVLRHHRAVSAACSISSIDNRPPGGVRIGDVGLGAGTLAAYAFKGDFLTFYEINPAVIDMSTSGEWFTYIADCREPAAHMCDIKLGDARLIARARSTNAKLAAISRAGPRRLQRRRRADAFADDRGLRNLSAAVRHGGSRRRRRCSDRAYIQPLPGPDASRSGRGRKLGLRCVEIHSPKVPEQLINSADWMILTKNEQLIAELAGGVQAREPRKPPVLWTDARSSLV